jgi:hypothetical protein
VAVSAYAAVTAIERQGSKEAVMKVTGADGMTAMVELLRRMTEETRQDEARNQRVVGRAGAAISRVAAQGTDLFERAGGAANLFARQLGAAVGRHGQSGLEALLAKLPANLETVTTDDLLRAFLELGLAIDDQEGPSASALEELAGALRALPDRLRAEVEGAVETAADHDRRVLADIEQRLKEVMVAIVARAHSPG